MSHRTNFRSESLALNQHPFVADRASALDAARLLADLGDAAAAAAAARAEISRGLGNVAQFCRWRQIERLIDMMTDADSKQTRH
ncbi:MAG: hypothetical protein ACOYLK_07665 [Sphingomonas sp.]|jgi:hypothetical protein